MSTPQTQLDGLVVFVNVAQMGGFSSAAAKLGMSPSAVSQAIQKLEARLGAPLFMRTTRSVRLTDAGERYFARVAPAVDELNGATDELRDVGSRPAGLLRLNVSRAAYLFVLRPVLQRFLAAYPEVELEIAVESALVDIVRLGFDAGIRYGDMVERDMVALQVGPALSSCVVASPAYLAHHVAPKHPQDLLDHDCIRFRYPSSGRTNRWLFEKGKKRLALDVSGRLTLNDDAGMVEAALAGVGVAYLTSGYVAAHLEQGRLVRLLSEWSPDMPALSLYYPSRRSAPSRLRALVDFLRSAHGVKPSHVSQRRRPGRRAARA